MFNFIRVVIHDGEEPERRPFGWRFFWFVAIVLALSALADLLGVGH